MKKLTYDTLSTIAGIAAAVAARKIVSALWRSDTEPPLNLADRRTSWQEALTWGLATAVGAAVARMIGQQVRRQWPARLGPGLIRSGARPPY